MSRRLKITEEKAITEEGPEVREEEDEEEDVEEASGHMEGMDLHGATTSKRPGPIPIRKLTTSKT